MHGECRGAMQCVMRCTAIYFGAQQQQRMHRAVTQTWKFALFFRAIFTLILKKGVFLLVCSLIEAHEKNINLIFNPNMLNVLSMCFIYNFCS